MNLSKNDIDYINNVLLKAGEILLKYFKTGIDYKEKTSVRDILTKADLESESYIVNQLQNRFRDIDICSEENSYCATQKNARFIIDPLEGTSNLVLGIPVFVIAIALAEGDKCLFSMVHYPVLNTTYHAIKGKGAYKNGNKITVNDKSDISRCSVHTNYSYNTSSDVRNILDKALYDLHIKRKLDDWCGIYYYCLLSEGNIEAIFTDESNEYDVIPGKFIAQEAGATITNWKGEETQELSLERHLASNGTVLHQELIKILSKI